MQARIISPNYDAFGDEEYPRQMWLVKIEKVYATRVKISYLQKVFTQMKIEDGKKVIYIEPKETIQNKSSSVKVRKNQYSWLVNNPNIQYCIGVAKDTYFYFQILLIDYDNKPLSTVNLTLPQFKA